MDDLDLTAAPAKDTALTSLALLAQLPSVAPDSGGITGWAVSLMETLGGPGAMVATILDSVFPPIPSELILPLAGFTAYRGGMTLAGAIIWSTIGSLIGALILGGYALGSQWARIEEWAGWFQYAVIAFFVILIARWVRQKLKGRRTP